MRSTAWHDHRHRFPFIPILCCACQVANLRDKSCSSGIDDVSQEAPPDGSLSSLLLCQAQLPRCHCAVARARVQDRCIGREQQGADVAVFTEAELRKCCQAGAGVCGLQTFCIKDLRHNAQLATPRTKASSSAMQREHLHRVVLRTQGVPLLCAMQH